MVSKRNTESHSQKMPLESGQNFGLGAASYFKEMHKLQHFLGQSKQKGHNVQRTDFRCQWQSNGRKSTRATSQEPRHRDCPVRRDAHRVMPTR